MMKKNMVSWFRSWLVKSFHVTIYIPNLAYNVYIIYIITKLSYFLHILQNWTYISCYLSVPKKSFFFFCPVYYTFCFYLSALFLLLLLLLYTLYLIENNKYILYICLFYLYWQSTSLVYILSHIITFLQAQIHAPLSAGKCHVLVYSSFDACDYIEALRLGIVIVERNL